MVRRRTDPDREPGPASVRNWPRSVSPCLLRLNTGDTSCAAFAEQPVSADMSAQQGLRHRRELDLVRALVYPRDPQIPVPALDRQLPGIPGGTMKLQHPVHDAVRHPGGRQFRGASFMASAPALIDGPG